jgi:hypothetical protein
MDLKKFCTVCGKQMNEIGRYENTTYDRDTGKPIVFIMVYLACPDYQEGYSDREWHTHDKISVRVES